MEKSQKKTAILLAEAVHEFLQLHQANMQMV
jgi:hypothetical protein